MLLTVIPSLLSVFASGLLFLFGLGVPLAVLHLALAVGVVPLILAAMIHFVPVLTRTGAPLRAVRRLPVLAQLAGGLAVLAMQGWLAPSALLAAECLDLVLALSLLVWILLRLKHCLGPAHPGARWYAAALCCLALALVSVAAIWFFPERWHALRLLHLHLNTLGLVGLAAFGTMPLLLPTALGIVDPGAGAWLRRNLLLALVAVASLVAGAALSWPWSLPGALLALSGIVELLLHWRRQPGLQKVLSDGVAASLSAAALGFLCCLVAGIGHAAALWPARPTLYAWGAAFLLPLLSGAIAQLLPVWRWPGPEIPARRIMRDRLAAGGRWRAPLFLAGGLFMLADEFPAAGLLLALAGASFAFDLMRAMRVCASTR